jgi:hypothetical protein
VPVLHPLSYVADPDQRVIAGWAPRSLVLKLQCGAPSSRIGGSELQRGEFAVLNLKP